MGKNYVKLWKQGDIFGIETNVNKEDEFRDELSSALSKIIEEQKFDGDWEYQFQSWLPQAFEIFAKLRGYKSAVEEVRMLRAGSAAYHDSDVVVDTANVEVS